MKKIIDFLWNVERVENLFVVIAVFLAIGTAWVSALKFYFELRVALEDVVNRFFRREDFKVKRTILKAIAKDDQTQLIKLRTLRVFKDLDSIDIDQSPELVDKNDPGYVKTSDQYSIPGVVRETHTYRLKVDFRKDEMPKARHDYTYVTSHVLNRTMQDLWGEPGIVASKPVGSESLTIEFFCAPKWCFKRNSGGKPELQVYYYLEEESAEKVRVDIPPKQIIPEGGSYPFNEKEGPIDWIRVIVKKPPKNADVYVDWVWDDGTQKYFDQLEAAKLAVAKAEAAELAPGQKNPGA